jgi:pimeloyl-ACP methyl ester carboxylesterase
MLEIAPEGTGGMQRQAGWQDELRCSTGEPMNETSKAVFLSYASQDAEAARRICEALRGAGIEDWRDQSELRGGEAWDAAIRRQIQACALLMPIISANTRALRFLGAVRAVAGSYASPPTITRCLHQRMKRSQLRVFERCRHFSYQDKADEFAEMVLVWVGGGYRGV